MGSTLVVNGQTVVHKESGGVVTTTDVCKTPVGNTVVPIPYTNVARSVDVANGSSTVAVDGHPVMLKDSVFSRSSGDEPGSLGGVASGVTGGKAKFVNFSNNVFFEGRPVCRRLDPMVSNLSGTGNTPPAPLMQENIAVAADDHQGHRIPFTFSFRHPDLKSGRVEFPSFTARHAMEGTTDPGDDPDGYCDDVHLAGAPGTHDLRFADFERERKKLPREETTT
ncbi:DUF4150 domain-containing protein [Geobacter sulfurreducens]|uniref:DUF4150 domain-containing protein n=1 Tax=Geobacter sulfurreducens TaxID=35554 RepID=UPI002C745A2F|nr:DUF4150 domain-containing protein [Geobacter sulfurreducens]HML76984.1 DUF4150 domain-containing protein [Geobacter sulfurreducens]